VRPGRRFFGEAFVADSLKWIIGKGLKSVFEKPFYDDLHKYIGTEKLFCPVPVNKSVIQG
jgi:hypothetical protein